MICKTNLTQKSRNMENKNLVIGNTSQLSYYFPDDYVKISSRNIDFSKYENSYFNRIYFCFAEQRTFIENNIDIFIDTNVTYVLKLIDFFSPKCNNIIIYLTSELWNNCTGAISLDLECNYNYSPYIKSKDLLRTSINNNKRNIIALYPVNFNSPHRKPGFLFSKIFDSIIHDKHIEIGDTYFYRDIVHPKYVAMQSINATHDMLIGSGRLIFINDFIRTLYASLNMKYEEYVKENDICNNKMKRNIYYVKSSNILFPFEKLIEYTVNEIKIQKKLFNK